MIVCVNIVSLKCVNKAMFLECMNYLSRIMHVFVLGCVLLCLDTDVFYPYRKRAAYKSHKSNREKDLQFV